MINRPALLAEQILENTKRAGLIRTHNLRSLIVA